MKLLQIFYTSQGQDRTREEFANDSLTALSQAMKHFFQFGNGDESDIEIYQP